MHKTETWFLIKPHSNFFKLKVHKSVKYDIFVTETELNKIHTNDKEVIIQNIAIDFAY